LDNFGFGEFGQDAAPDLGLVYGQERNSLPIPKLSNNLPIPKLSIFVNEIKLLQVI